MILRTKEQFMKYLDCTEDEVLAFIEAGLPTVEPVTDLGFITTSKLIDQWIEGLHTGRVIDQWVKEGETRASEARARSSQPVQIITTENPVEDLRAVVNRLRGEGYKNPAELLASLEHTLGLLEAEAA
jgi:hypothetical protein